MLIREKARAVISSLSLKVVTTGREGHPRDAAAVGVAGRDVPAVGEKAIALMALLCPSSLPSLPVAVSQAEGLEARCR